MWKGKTKRILSNLVGMVLGYLKVTLCVAESSVKGRFSLSQLFPFPSFFGQVDWLIVIFEVWKRENVPWWWPSYRRWCCAWILRPLRKHVPNHVVGECVLSLSGLPFTRKLCLLDMV